MAIRIPLGQVKEGVNELDMRISPSDTGIESGLIPSDLDLFVRAERISNQINLNLTISGTMKLECDRCLENYERKFSTRFELVYIVRDDQREPDDDEYIRTYSPHMRYIDITKDVKDFVELAVPMRRVPEENADGSCSWCGKSAEYWKSILKEEGEAED